MCVLVPGRLTGKRWCPWTLHREFVYGYKAGHLVWKTLCHKTQLSWFDIWQLQNIPAGFSSPNLPAVQLKMEMIYVPQGLTDWQAMQEAVVGPWCGCGISKAMRRNIVEITGMLSVLGSWRFLIPTQAEICMALGGREVGCDFYWN